MKIDARTTNHLFKTEAFWNGFGFFATYEHANLLRDAVSGYMKAHAVEVKTLIDFEKNLEEAIGFVRFMQDGKEAPLEKEIGEEIDRLNLRHQTQTFKFVDLESEGILTFLENSRELPQREMKRVLHQLLALQQMRDAMDESLNEGINSFDEETELKRVERILHQEFDLNHIDHLVGEAKKEPLTNLEQAKREAVALADGEMTQIYQPLFHIIFETVKKEKEKLGIE